MKSFSTTFMATSMKARTHVLLSFSEGIIFQTVKIFRKTCRVCEFKKDKLKNKNTKKMPSVILYEENPLDRL